MKRRKTRQVPANPLLVWADLAFKTSEMLLASAQVISHRTGRIAKAGPNPNARDRKEFTLMGQEKIEAAAESAQAMAIRMVSINQQMGVLAFTQMMSTATGMMALATSRTMAQSAKRQAELVRDAVTDSAAAASQLSGSVARLANHGLKPVHSRATGNAKRLLKD